MFFDSPAEAVKRIPKAPQWPKPAVLVPPLREQSMEVVPLIERLIKRLGNSALEGVSR